MGKEPRLEHTRQLINELSRDWLTTGNDRGLLQTNLRAETREKKKEKSKFYAYRVKMKYTVRGKKIQDVQTHDGRAQKTYKAVTGSMPDP